MLILSRKRSEGITISHPAGDIHVVVVEIRGDKVRIGVEADVAIDVNRDEVKAAIERTGRIRTTETIPRQSLSPEELGATLQQVDGETA